MWRYLKNLVEIIPESNWDYLRKHKFQARCSGCFDDWVNSIIIKEGDSIYGIRIGKIDKWHVNLVPIKSPHKWFVANIKDVEVFISEEDLIKIFPCIFAGG